MKRRELEIPSTLVVFGAWFAIAVTLLIMIFLPPPAGATNFDSNIQVLEDHPIQGATNWLGDVYMKPDGKTFSHCVVSSPQKYGRNVQAHFVVKSGGNGIVLSLSAADWHTTDDKEYTIRLQLDDNRLVPVVAYGFGIGFNVPYNKDAIEPLLSDVAKAKRLYVYREGLDRPIIGFDLSGAHVAFGWLRRCIENGKELTSAGNSPINPPKPQAVKPKSPVVPAAPKLKKLPEVDG